MVGLKKTNKKIIYTELLDKSEKDFLYRFDAHYNEKNVGYLTSHKSNDGNYIWLKGLYVKKKFRNLGIATTLIKRALKKYKNKEIRLRARPYKKKSKTAKELIKFYKKFGFEIYDKENRMKLLNS